MLKNIDIEHLLKLPFLDFKSVVNLETGEILSKRVTHYHFCKIIIHDSGAVFFTGSIHKLFNSLKEIKAPNHKTTKEYKGFNGNQFYLENIIEVRKHLEELFACSSSQMIFQNIEFGINTKPTFNPQLFITGLLCQNSTLFEYRYKNHFASTPFQRYEMKIYNKSNQYGMIEYILRYELKFIKTEDLKPLGIRTFKDINTPTLNKAIQLLLKYFDRVIYYDKTITLKSLNDRQKRLLERYSNPRYWNSGMTKKKRYENKNKLNDYIEKYSQNLHQKIRKEIEQKGVLINQLPETNKGVLINWLSETKKEVLINTSCIELKSTFQEAPIYINRTRI